jgi:hypothetical protein
MARFRSLAFFLLCLGTCVCSSGCIAFYLPVPVQVTVRDAETGAPIPDAHVDVFTNAMLLLNMPRPESAVTNDQGAARLTAATSQLQTWRTAANDYLPNHELKVLYKSQPLEFRLYRKPEPLLNIAVPNGYRGPLKIELRPIPGWIQTRPGDREFRFKASPTGYVRIDATPLLVKVMYNLDWVHAYFEDGTAIPRVDYITKPTDISLRWVDLLDSRVLFVVRTEQDEQAVRPRVFDYANGDPHNVSTNCEKFNGLFSEPAPKPGG